MRPMSAVFAIDIRLLLVVVAVAGLAGGAVATLLGAPTAATFWSAGTLPVLAALAVEIALSLRRGEVGLDIVAALSMTAALAFGEALAGNVVALMYAGGGALERFAEGRARREMTALLGRVSRTAMRHAGGAVEEVAIERILPGDRLLVRRGEVVPVDGVVAAGAALLDESALTGEPLPVRRAVGEAVASGSTSAGDAFDLTVARRAADSTYAGIVRLVEAAAASRAPMVRMADRYALWFLALTLVLAGLAWGISGDRVRALAVLVVATPCPLILAVPVAVISGMSRAAARGVLVKNGGALEALAGIGTAVLDKTGTLTLGRAAVAEVRVAPGFDVGTVLRLAASLDQASTHVTAETLVAAAVAAGLTLSRPTGVEEVAGIGIAGDVEGRRVVVGGTGFVLGRCRGGDPATLADGAAAGMQRVAIGIDGTLAAVVHLADPLRPDAAAVIAAFRAAGVGRIVLASGDRAEVVAAVGAALALDAAVGELDPAEKVEIVRREKEAARVMMVGDGVNDAPALAMADVGVAMGARGSAASSEAADVVVLVDHLGRLAEALAIARRTRRIALESVVVGLGLSVAAMCVAAFGFLPPLAGALSQEAIDVAVILNALRALRPVPAVVAPEA